MMGIEKLFSCEGKVALVTGAASGLGWTFAETMAEAGADVACADIDRTGLAEAVAMVESLGRRAVGIACDVSDEAQVKAMVDLTVAQLGGLHVLFNNAGVGQAPAPLHELATEDWKRLIDVDLHGAFFCAREALKIMVAQRYGKIVNVSSMWGMVASSRLQSCPSYNAAKGALVNLTRELAQCYGPYGINVNAICPGFIKTKIGNNCSDDPEWRALAEPMVPLGRIGMPDELKGLALLLASDAGSYITGDCIPVDGGYLAG
jgi:NAD(P)-dependent dehydrogenase (short-subunit alcohol dehydrogenase family)